MPRLRAVVVTNEESEYEGVVIAVEMYPWHPTPAEAEACQDALCQKCHRQAVIEPFTFDFDRRRVLLGGTVPNSLGCHPIPDEKLARFNADFGVFYSS